MEQPLHGGGRRAGIEGNYQRAAVGAAAERANRHAAPGHGRAAQTNLPGTGTLILYRQHILPADAVIAERHRDVTAAKIRGVAVGHRGVTARVNQHRATTLGKADRITIQIADNRRR